MRAKTKTKHVLIRKLLYADDSVLVAHSEMHLQILCERCAKACTDFGMTINLKKTVVMPIGTLNPPHILINGSLLMLLTSSLIWDLLSTVRTICTTKSTNELKRLPSTLGDLVLGFGKITISVLNKRSGSTPRTSRIFCYTAARRSAHTATKKTGSMHFISDAFAPFLVSHGRTMTLTLLSCMSPLIWPHHHHEAVTYALDGPRPSYGRWSPVQVYSLRRVIQRAS